MAVGVATMVTRQQHFSGANNECACSSYGSEHLWSNVADHVGNGHVTISTDVAFVIDGTGVTGVTGVTGGTDD